jgi:anti-sigma regulatory factor (Ser/Thr protein kinase)
MQASDSAMVMIELSNDIEAARRAREFLRDVLLKWCLQDVSAVAELLTDELVANVVRHVRAPMRVRAVRQPSSIRVEVDDPSTELPARQEPEPTDDHGRGIVLVESLASAWGVAVRKDGKTVWFEIDLEAEGSGSGER